GGVLAATAAGSATPAITIGYDASSPVFKVDAKGKAEGDWTEHGARETMLVPSTRRDLPNRQISHPDLSKSASGVTLPYLRVLRRTPDGRLWALQSWRVQPNGPVELRLSRWKGEPTAVRGTVDGGRLTGTATFQGHGVFGFSPTTAGTPIRLY